MSLFLVSEPILFFQVAIIFKGSWKACDHRHLCPSCLMSKIALSLPDVRKQGHFHFRAVMVAADLFLVQVRSKLSIPPCHLERYNNLGKGRQGWCLKHFFPRGTVQPPYITSCHLLGADDSTATRAPTAPGAHRPLSPQSSQLFTFPLFSLKAFLPLFPPLERLPLSFGLFKPQEKPLTSSYFCFPRGIKWSDDLLWGRYSYDRK